jgi:uncharacterized protein (TIGR00255 family)
MTGFGAASRAWTSAEGPGRVDVEVRSVNARFLELKIRQPFGPRIEPALRRAVEARLHRGRVELSVFIRRPASATDDTGMLAVEPVGGVPRERVHEAVAAAVEVTRIAHRQGLELSAPTSLELLEFLKSSVRGSGPIDAAVDPPPFLDALVGEALAELCQFRESEGRALHDAISALAHELTATVEALRSDGPAAAARLHARWTERLADVQLQTGAPPPDPDRVAAELALLLIRADFEEELARIGSHLEQVREVLAGEARKGQGKTLDFVSQELLREVTTIGSKITSHRGSRVVIDAKAIIERIREQVHNVE